MYILPTNINFFLYFILRVFKNIRIEFYACLKTLQNTSFFIVL